MIDRMPNERYASCCITEHDRHGGGSIIVWASIWHGGRTVPVVVEGNLNTEVEERDIFCACRDSHGSQQQPHVPGRQCSISPHCCSHEDCLRSRISTLPWSSRSPILSSIEHAWDELGRRIRDIYEQPPSTLKELAERLRVEWSRLDQAFLDSLSCSMPERLKACQAARGATRV